jgi:hypothetical protein
MWECENSYRYHSSRNPMVKDILAGVKHFTYNEFTTKMDTYNWTVLETSWRSKCICGWRSAYFKGASALDSAQAEQRMHDAGIW